MKIWLIRHGQTDWNVRGRIQGSSDTDLNEEGKKQAKELALELVKTKHDPEIIYASTQKRAKETAQIISKYLKIPYVTKKGLEEMNLGEWEGLSWEQVEERYQEEYQVWKNNRRYQNTPNGESYQELLDRVLAAILEIIEENAEKEHILIVTHSAVIMSLLCYFSNTPFEDMLQFKITNAGISEFDSEQFLCVPKK